MRRYDLVVWDWNGTLLDDVDVNIRTINVLLEKRGIAPVKSREDYLSRFRFPIIDYYTELGFDVVNEDFADIAEDYINVYRKEAEDAGLFPGTEDVLCALKEAGIRQVIVSAAEGVRLRGEVKSRGIDGYFTDIIGKGDNRGDGKLSLGREFVASAGVAADRILFVGDMDHDAELALACGCDAVMVAKGHMSKERLEALGLKVMSDVTDVVKLCI